MMSDIIFYAVPAFAVVAGLFIAATDRNIIKIIIALGVTETGVNLLLISSGFVRGGTAPILDHPWKTLVDPVPQALVLTAIVIGLAVTAMALAVAVRIREKFGSLDLKKINESEK